MSLRGLAGDPNGGLSAEGTGPGETPKATHVEDGGMPAEEAGGFAAEKLPPAAGGLAAGGDPPMEDPRRPAGGIAAGAEEDGGLATVAPAGVAPMAALQRMTRAGCAPSAGGGLSAVAKPREDCPFDEVKSEEEEGPEAKLTREAM